MKEYKNYEENINELNLLINDKNCEKEIKEMAIEEIKENENKLNSIENNLIISAIPKDEYYFNLLVMIIKMLLWNLDQVLVVKKLVYLL